MKIKKLNESSLVDKKVSTLGKKGKPMYVTADQLKDAKAKYPEYDFEETTIEYSLPAGQKAYIAKKKTNESKSIKEDLEDIEFIVDTYLPDLLVSDTDKPGKYEMSYRGNDSVSVIVEFDPSYSEYVFTIDGEGPYSHGSYEYIQGEIERALDKKLQKNESKSIKEFGAKARKLDEAEEILYVIKDSHGNQLSKPTADDSELWDRVASMEARGRRGLRVVVYTGKKESLDEDKGQPRSNRYRTYFNRIKRAIEKGDEETLKRTKEAIMYAPAKELKSSEASKLMDMIKNRKITESVSGKYGEVKYEPRRDGMSGESAVYANYHLFSNDGKYTPYWAGERPMGISYNSVEDAVKGIDAFIDRQRKDGKMLYMKPVNESSYGGAFDIEDDQYFTKEELVEFGEDVVDNLNSLAYSKAKLESIFIDNNVIEITITWDGNEITVEQPIDMRRIRTPKDLGKYRVPVISKMKPELEELGFDFGPHLGDYELSESFDTELRDKLVRMWFEENTADWLVKNDPVTAEWLAYGGATTDDFAEVEEEVLAKLNGGDGPKEAKWERLITKSVNDSDGFTTDYSMWYNDGEKRWVFIFGDSDVYDPTNTDPDWETEDPEEARQWFLDYKGFEDTDESLKEDWRTGTFTRDDLTSYRAEMKKRVEGVVYSIRSMKEKHPEYAEIFDNLTDELVDSLSFLKTEEMKESITVEKQPGKIAQDVMDYLEVIMNSEDFNDEKYFDEYDREAFGKTYDALSDYALSVRASFEDLHEDAADDDLETAEQKISSAATSINSNKLPAIFRMVKFQPDTMNLDYGGGKFDNAAEELAKINVTNLVYDPYNRSSEHNQDVLKQVRANGGADTVTISNVLNVIAEPEARQTVLRNAKKLVKPGGKVYITVYEGNKSGSGAETKAGYQLNKDTKDYVDEISQVFDNVTRKGKLIIAE